MYAKPSYPKQTPIKRSDLFRFLSLADMNSADFLSPRHMQEEDEIVRAIEGELPAGCVQSDEKFITH